MFRLLLLSAVGFLACSNGPVSQECTVYLSMAQPEKVAIVSEALELSAVQNHVSPVMLECARQLIPEVARALGNLCALDGDFEQAVMLATVYINETCNIEEEAT